MHRARSVLERKLKEESDERARLNEEIGELKATLPKKLANDEAAAE